MDDNVFIFETIAGMIFFCVGIRLYRLSRNTRQMPEYLIALTFVAWALSFAIYNVGYLLAPEYDSVAPPFQFGYLIAVDVGNIAIALFTREVFRKDDRWATWLVVAIGLLMIFGVVASAAVGDFEQIDPVGNPGYWPQTIGGLAPNAWMGVEGFRQYLNARRRLKLGLCTPLTCQSFLLWGIVGGLWTALEVVLVAQDHFLMDVGELSSALGIANGLLELVPIALVWLIFFPPGFYRRWIEGAKAA